jgi:hypothetical protein
MLRMLEIFTMVIGTLIVGLNLLSVTIQLLIHTHYFDYIPSFKVLDKVNGIAADRFIATEPKNVLSYTRFFYNMLAFVSFSILLTFHFTPKLFDFFTLVAITSMVEFLLSIDDKMVNKAYIFERFAFVNGFLSISSYYKKLEEESNNVIVKGASGGIILQGIKKDWSKE